MTYKSTIVELKRLQEHLTLMTPYCDLHSVVPLPGRYETDRVIVITSQTAEQASWARKSNASAKAAGLVSS